MVAPAANPLHRILTPLVECLNVESAEQLLRFQLDAETQARIDELAEKSDQGTLSEAEKREYLQYVEAIDIVGVLQAKAKNMLQYSRS